MSAEEDIAVLRSKAEQLATAVREAGERNGGDGEEVHKRVVAVIMTRASEECQPAELAERIDQFHVWSAGKITELQKARAADEAAGVPFQGSRLEAIAEGINAECRERAAALQAEVDEAEAAAWHKAVEELARLLAHVETIEGLSHGRA